jgi:hypothetical protein
MSVLLLYRGRLKLVLASKKEEGGNKRERVEGRTRLEGGAKRIEESKGKMTEERRETEKKRG